MSGIGSSRVLRLAALGSICLSAALLVQGDPAPAQSQVACRSFSTSMCFRKGYLDSVCGRANAERCRQVVNERFHRYYSSLPSSLDARLFRAECTTIPATLRQGKAQPYRPVRETRDNGGTTFAGRMHERRSRMRVSPSTAATARANPAWEENGARVESCDEYVYEKYYDWNRFRDALAACGDDSACVYRVASSTGRPGLRRTLRGRDNSVLPHQFNGRTGIYAKNPFYETTDFLMWDPRLGSEPAFYSQLASLRTEVQAGRRYYSIGESGTSHHYGDVWAFMDDMHGSTRSMTPAEREEVLRRQRHLSMLINRYRSAATLILVERARSATGRIAAVSQLAEARMHMDQDAIAERLSTDGLSRLNQLILTAPTAERTSVRQAITPTMLQVDTQAVQQATGGSSIGTTDPRKPGPQLRRRVVRRTTATRPATNLCRLPEYGCPEDAPNDSPHELAGKAFCRVTAFLANEWERKKAGQGGCFDRSRHDCDWNLDTFAEFIRGWDPYSREMEEDYNYCKQWWPVVRQRSFSAVPTAHRAMEEKREEMEEHLRDLPQLARQSSGPVRIGSSVNGGESWGDLGSWSAMYDYTALWELRAHRDTSTNPPSFCQLQGRTHGLLKASITTPLDDDIDEIADSEVSNLWNQLIDAEGWIRVNQDENGEPDQEAAAFAKLIVAGQEILEPTNVDMKLSHTMTESHAGDIETPHAGFTVLLGGVPINVNAWAEFTYGGSFSASAGLPGTEDCSALYRATATYTPTVAAYGIVKVSAGVDGIMAIGVRGDVNLVDISVPITVDGAVQLGRHRATDVEASDLVELAFVIGAEADMTIATLSGRVSLYIDYLLDTYKKTLFTWDGLGPYEVSVMPRVEQRFPLTVFTL